MGRGGAALGGAVLRKYRWEFAAPGLLGRRRFAEWWALWQSVLSGCEANWNWESCLGPSLGEGALDLWDHSPCTFSYYGPSFSHSPGDLG